MFGVDIETLARVLDAKKSDDPTLTAAKHIALAYAAIQQLQDDGVDITYYSKPLVLSALERAYREVFHLRKSLPNGMLTWNFMTKYGRLVKDET